MNFADQDALIEDDPDIYYLKEHAISTTRLLPVQLHIFDADALHDLIMPGLPFPVSARIGKSDRTAPANDRAVDTGSLK